MAAKDGSECKPSAADALYALAPTMKDRRSFENVILGSSQVMLGSTRPLEFRNDKAPARCSTRLASSCGHSVRNEWLFCAGQGLQGEDLAPLMWADGNAIGDRVSLQLLHWVFIRLVQCQVALFSASLTIAPGAPDNGRSDTQWCVSVVRALQLWVL